MTAVAIAFVACLGVAAVLLLVTGRSYVYAPGVGANMRLGFLLPWSVVIFGVGAGIGALLHWSAGAFPQRYYQFVWWRDAAWLVCLVAALGATLIYMGALVTYGAP